MTDPDLIERTLSGDKQAFGTLVDRYRQQVYALAFHYVQDFEVARDVAQDAFVQAYLRLAQLREPARFTAWLRTLAVNECRMWLRRRQDATLSLDSDAARSVHDPYPGPHHLVEQKQLSIMVRYAIQSLPERQQLTVTLFYLSGLSAQAVAEFLDESVNAVESRLHRARTHLKERMMKVIDDSLKPHQLPEQFADGVLQRVDWIQVKRGPDQPDNGRESSVMLKDEKQRTFHIRLSAEQTAVIYAEIRPILRPLTQATLNNIMQAFQITIDRVVLTDVSRGEYQARISGRINEKPYSVAAQAGDAFAVAWKADPKPEFFATPKALRKARNLERATQDDAAEDATSDVTHGVAPEDHAGSSPILLEPVQANAEATPVEQSVPDKNYALWGWGHIEIPDESKKPGPEERERERQEMMRRRTSNWPRKKWGKQRVARLALRSDDSYKSGVVTLIVGKQQVSIWMDLTSVQSVQSAARGGVEVKNLPPASRHSPAVNGHNLLKSLLDACVVQVLQVSIDAFLHSTYYSVILLRHNGKMHYLDARPSDAIALAVRCGCPVTVGGKVISQRGMDVQIAVCQHQVYDAKLFIAEALYVIIGGHLVNHHVELTPIGEACRAAVIDAQGNIIWEQVGSIYQQCSRLLSEDDKTLPKSPFVKEGFARVAVMTDPEEKPDEISVAVKFRKKNGPVELTPILPEEAAPQ
jgi:RNA polymerase sigma factor (sigma-70 family)